MKVGLFEQLTLVVEASTSTGSVALIERNAAVGALSVAMGVGTKDNLFPAVQALFVNANRTPHDVAAIVCGAGPGSFTSLRIAASLCKGLAQPLGIPLFEIPSLLLAAASLQDAAERFVVHSNALRGERYVQWVNNSSGAFSADGDVARVSVEQLQTSTTEAQRVAVVESSPTLASRWLITSNAACAVHAFGPWRDAPVSLANWEPAYGRLAEAQVKWEASHGRALPVSEVGQ